MSFTPCRWDFLPARSRPSFQRLRTARWSALRSVGWDSVQRFFQLGEARLRRARHAAAADLHRHLRRVAVQMGNQNIAYDVIELGFLVDETFQPNGGGANQTKNQKSRREPCRPARRRSCRKDFPAAG